MSVINTTIVIPVFNDWLSVSKLIPQIDTVGKEAQIKISLVLVNDGSDEVSSLDITKTFQSIGSIEILHLACNLGHQRAIAVGLVDISNKSDSEVVIVMDGDGEDRPEDIKLLIDEYRNSDANCIVVAKRDKRSEGMVFKISYFFYKLLFRLLTGEKIDFGNYCLLPKRLLCRLVYKDSLWNHLAATVLRSNNDLRMVSTCRGNRIDGKAKMNFTGLVLHGLSAISIFNDRVLVRAMKFFILMSVIIAGLAFAFSIVSVLLYSEVVQIILIACFILFILTCLLLFISVALLLVELSSRSKNSVVPVKESANYVQSIESIYES